MTKTNQAAARLAFAALAMSGSTASSAGEEGLDAYRWKSRVVVFSAADSADPRLAEQRAALASVGPGRKDHDLVTIEAVGNGAWAQALRRRLDIPAGAFRAVLIGKDGGVKLSSAEPIQPQTLFATIDAMPMRREEMQRR